MIDAGRLLKDLQGVLRQLEDDLRERVAEEGAIADRLRAQHAEARGAERTAAAFEVWRDEQLTQVAVAWILGCVFVRFMEDNHLLSTPRLAGVGERYQTALDQRELFFRHPERRAHSDREYLLDVFAQARRLPAAASLFDERHNPIWMVGLSGDGATLLLRFWQRRDPETGQLVHDFSDPEWQTRFLGDLYQDLSQEARKKYALLQTPEFVESFILDRTLGPAIDVFGVDQIRLIDPTCGSGHFLLGAFARLYDRHRQIAPGAEPRELVQRALEQVYGVDVNPYAVAIARFRLLVAALRVCYGDRVPRGAPGFRLNLAVGDSLLHGRRFRAIAGVQMELVQEEDPLRHVYETEDAEELARVLGQQYHVVVGNPPYITAKDKALRDRYRQKYASCHREYSLAAPFVERFFDLTVPATEGWAAGFTGMIVANAFMKREFGKRLVEEVLPRLDLTTVIDTSGAYIPGHGTPTLILVGRHQRTTTADAVRAALGIRGEPRTPDDPEQGLVWRSIVEQIDQADAENDYISIRDIPRSVFNSHPWSLGGGGAAELKEEIGEGVENKLGELVESIGFGCITKQDDVFVQPKHVLDRHRLSQERLRLFGIGEDVRDWGHTASIVVIFPYDNKIQVLSLRDLSTAAIEFMWPYRTNLFARKVFGGATYREASKPWYEFGQIPPDRYLTFFSIAFPFVATHNHFVLDRGGKVFNRTAPIIKLPKDANEDDHLALLGLLNSSTACFWMKQVFHNKGSTVDDKGARQTTVAFENFYEFTGTGLQAFPVVEDRPLELARRLDALATELGQISPAAWGEETPARATSHEALRQRAETILRRMIALQEELDWRVYAAYGLLDEDLAHVGNPPPIELGWRAFELLMARKMAADRLQTTWFERHGSTPVSELPAELPANYRQLVEKRLDAIARNRNLRLIEQPEYKRRWNTEPWEKQLEKALYGWLAGRLEAPELWSDGELQSVARLAEQVQRDDDFMRVAELYRGHAHFNVQNLVAELVEAEAVPLMAALRYKPAGLRKHAIWQRTWELQRREDALDARAELPAEDPDQLSADAVEAAKKEQIGTIPVPPKYSSGDFQTSVIWRLRGKLDVAKERFFSLPCCERQSDPSLVIGWSGWNALEQARAVAACYLHMKDDEGWSASRLTPLLTALGELVPWVKQWHNQLDPTHRVRMGDYFADFLREEARLLGLSGEQIAAWQPEKKRRARGKKTKKTAAEDARAPGSPD